jgi:hypothetical protein
MAAAFQFLYLLLLLMKMRANLLEQDLASGWVKKIVFERQKNLKNK